MSEPTDRPARSIAQLLENYWAAFHHAWGVNAQGGYSKTAWMDLQETTQQLFERTGIERRRVPRAPGEVWPRR